MNRTTYFQFGPESSMYWGKRNYSDWLPWLQTKEYEALSDTDKFFRHYTQGIHYVYNQKLRANTALAPQDEIEQEYTKQIIAAIKEINKHPIPDNIIVYRYVNKHLYHAIKKWGVASKLLVDKSFLSTTLCLQCVTNRNYSCNYYRLLKIYVSKGTPGVYLDLVSDMSEREMLLLPNTKLQILKHNFFSRKIDCKVVI